MGVDPILIWSEVTNCLNTADAIACLLWDTDWPFEIVCVAG